MKDTQLYQQILGLTEPWFVERVELNMAEQRVDVYVGHRPEATFLCPVCNQERPLYDHADERVWRHLDSCQLKTYLHARVPRTGCPEHGIRKVKLPWAETRSRFTLLMERMIIDVILRCSTIAGACGIMRVSWDEAFGVMQRSVERGRARKQAAVVRHLGVDEKAFARPQLHDDRLRPGPGHRRTRRRRSQDREPGRLLRLADRRPTGRGRGGRDGHVGAVRAGDARRPAGRGGQDHHYGTATWARKFFDRWYGWAIRSRLTPVKKVAAMLRSRVGNVVSYCCGFRNPDNFETAIYFHCGGLNLYPL